MANKKGKGSMKNTAKKGKKGVKVRRRNGLRVSGAVGKMSQLARLLSDPCSAETTSGIYPGEVGMIERFIAELTLVNTANTAGYLAFHPNTGWIQYSNVATSSGASASTYSSTLGPGNSFLTTNAQKVRGLAACIQTVCSSLSITNITGEIACGVISTDTLANNGTISVDTLFTVLSARAALTRDIKEVKWHPASLDNRYSTYVNSTTYPNWQTTGTDFSDTNIVVVAIRNVPLNTTINVRITWVAEWTPKPLLGLVPLSTSAGGINHLAVASAMQKSHPSWWHNLVESAGSVASTFGNQAMLAFGNYAGDRLTKFLSSGSKSAASSNWAGPIIEEVGESLALAVI